MSSLQPGWLAGNGRYTLVRFLGSGGMGAVWLAEDGQLREQVVLKFLSPKIGLNGAALESLKREIARARKLTHPNVVRIHDFFQGEHEAFISMEFVDGAHLGALRLEQPHQVFASTNLKPLVTQVCDALDYAHKEGVVHGNIKPANLMADPKGRLKLTDFGLAARMSALGGLSETSVGCATMAYMSPDQLDGCMPSPSDDIYALGATLYELLTGVPPFSEGDIGEQIRNRTPRRMKERLSERGVPDDIPASLNGLVMSCLAKNLMERPPNARALAEAFNNIKESDAVPERVNKTSGAVLVGRESDLPILPPVENWPSSDAAPAPTQFLSITWVVVAIGIIALAGAAAWWTLSKKDSKPSVPIQAEANTNTPAESANDEMPENSSAKSPVRSRRPARVTYEATDFVISGTGFTVQDFDEGATSYSNRKYVWQQVPSKFRGWMFTQINLNRPATIRAHVKNSTTLFIAAAANPSGVVFPGWEPDRSMFTNDKGQLKMYVFRKQVHPGDNIRIPKNGKATVILIFPK